MLYVVAWPLMAEADDTALRRLRAQYHPDEADLIGPHFTLVFGAADDEERRLSDALAGLVAARPFWFVLDRVVRHDILAQLGLRDPVLSVSSFYRPNLRYVVHECAPRQQDSLLAAALDCRPLVVKPNREELGHIAQGFLFRLAGHEHPAAGHVFRRLGLQ